MRLCDKTGSKTKRQEPREASSSGLSFPTCTRVGLQSPTPFLLSLPCPSLSQSCLILAPAGVGGWPLSRRTEHRAVSHGCGEVQSIGRLVGCEGHLHYKLAVIKPLLTVMGSFQLEVMPATADDAGRATTARQAAITQAPLSVTGSSSHARRKVHFPAQLCTLPRDKCLLSFNLLQAEEAQRKRSITEKMFL